MRLRLRNCMEEYCEERCAAADGVGVAFQHSLLAKNVVESSADRGTMHWPLKLEVSRCCIAELE